MVVIDKRGKVVFSGHPTYRNDLCQDIINLLRSDKLPQSEGTEPYTLPEKVDIPQGYKQLSEEEIDCLNQEMDEFRETGRQLQESLGGLAEGMIRSVCAHVMIVNYSPATGNWVGKMENYRVLVGA